MRDRINAKELRDIEEMIPGNNIDHLYGHDGPDELAYDHEDFIQCQEHVNFEYEELFREAALLFDPEGIDA